MKRSAETDTRRSVHRARWHKPYLLALSAFVTSFAVVAVVGTVIVGVTAYAGPASSGPTTQEPGTSGSKTLSTALVSASTPSGDATSSSAPGPERIVVNVTIRSSSDQQWHVLGWR